MTRSTQKSVWEEIGGGEEELTLGKRTVPSRAYASWFNFKGRDQQRKAGLSGGERNRLHRAKLLRKGSNLLMLDEPTNDLDVDTPPARSRTRSSSSPARVVVISHDRWFLDRIATHMLAFEGESRVVWFEGNYQDYEADRKRRLGAERTSRTGSSRKLTR